MDIPRIFHHVWVGSPLPQYLADCIDTWRGHHPEWIFQLWKDSDLTWLRHSDLYREAPRLVPQDAVGQFRSDLARYEILHRYGGMYVDCDTVCLRPVDGLLDGHTAFAAAEDRNWIGNTYLAAMAGHPVTEELITGIRANVDRHYGRRPNWLTGPKYLTPIWRAHGCHVADQKLFYPYSYADVKAGTVPTDFGDAYAVHEWRHTREVLEARQQ